MVFHKEEYKAAKEAKNYDKVDELRAKLKAEGVIVKDMKTGIDWAFEEQFVLIPICQDFDEDTDIPCGPSSA